MRCLLVFEGKQPNPSALVEQVQKLLKECVHAQRCQADLQLLPQDLQATDRKAGQPLLVDNHPPVADHHPPSIASNLADSPHVQVSIHGGVVPSSTEPHVQVSIHGGEVPSSTEPLQHQPMGQHRRDGAMHWFGPNQGTVKINCDAVWDSSTGRGGIGVVARNHDG